MTREILNRAADLIEQNGHCKGRGADFATGALCALGGIFFASEELLSSGTFWDQRNARRASREALLKYLGTSPSVWNDHPDRTPEEVITALRKAASEVAE